MLDFKSLATQKANTLVIERFGHEGCYPTSCAHYSLVTSLVYSYLANSFISVTVAMVHSNKANRGLVLTFNSKSRLATPQTPLTDNIPLESPRRVSCTLPRRLPAAAAREFSLQRRYVLLTLHCTRRPRHLCSAQLLFLVLGGCGGGGGGGERASAPYSLDQWSIYLGFNHR